MVASLVEQSVLLKAETMADLMAVTMVEDWVVLMVELTAELSDESLAGCWAVSSAAHWVEK